ncbi:myoferlin-like isoform X3 [Physella acuta]|uniref:myoferlin-like isoform X3 n=1 Tax=Physella acuta TaxID=109671 RepID=UPI0027DB73BD|nr:myoferlin-like isoform X3 [Physella acuta]
MSLQVTVIGAENVPNPETIGKCDPYAVIEFQGHKKKTAVIKGDLNPKWNETFEFELVGNGVTAVDELFITVFDWERLGRNRQLGTAKLQLREFVKGGTRELTVQLIDSNKRPVPAASIKLKITCNQPESAKLAAAQAKTDEAGAKIVDLNDAGDEQVVEENVLDAAGLPIETVDPITGLKAYIKRKRVVHVPRKLRSQVSTKPQDIQIRIKVVQARQLAGSNLQPVVRVSVMNQIKQTRIKKSTTSPWWDESFFFNFHLPPSELIDEIIDFAVYNSRTLRSDALVGSFKCDVGLIYDEPSHSLVNKWVLLSDPEDATAGAKGYLKISACVMGPGDVSPNMAAKQNDEDEDIESNLLRPAGVQLRPATFLLRLYHAEDIPRMDSAFLEGVKKVLRIGEEQKELVDPFFIFGFAGKEVKSKIMYANDHPEWNQDLKLGLQFPSMCERMKFQIRDWDRLNQDDIVGTVFLPISLISSSGEQGYLPTFGPCYINFYGSTREYSDLPNDYEDLNLGKGEGVAYRGRALVELVTNLGELPDVPVEDISADDRLRVQKFMRRRKYRVHAAFLSAGMISSAHVDAPVEFEISIGNYGNKLDENIPPSASTTQPTNPVFDGCHYYFLPWGNTKPCVVVDCSWEDISFRLESLNILLNTIERLTSNLERVRIGIKAKLPIPELAQLLISMLDQLIEDCGSQFSPPKDGQHVCNELDKLTANFRKETLKSVKKSAKSLRENATDLDEALSEVENLLQILKNTAVEPQNSMPDVIIWMISGQKRIAYYRIPAYDLLYNDNENLRGKHCGKLITLPLKYPQVKDKDKKTELPAVLRIKLWLGMQVQEQAWHKMQSEGELAVYAETYENQVNILGAWTNKGPTMSRPKWSDSEGKIELNKNEFTPPPGWKWEGDWYISPELSMLYDKDAGHHTFLEDTYENQSRNLPGGAWAAASRPWTDVKGDPAQERNKIPLPSGWKWDDDWQADLNRAVDEDGWEYCVEATVGGYGPVEKTYHLCRRRRWVRHRTLVKEVAHAKQKLEKKQQEGWEYSALFNMKFHAEERTMDLVRRRRWHRKMVSTSSDGTCFFNVQHEGTEQEKEMVNLATMAAPRMFLAFKTPHKYQLRAYVYQARDLLAADDSGLSDPFARVCFITQSMVTEKQAKTLSPTWDQTLIFGEVEIYGDPKGLEMAPPEIYIELFDHDTFGKPEFLGRTTALPMVKLDPSDARTPVLQWYEINRHSQSGGELLAAFELIMIPDDIDEISDVSSDVDKISDVSSDITGKDLPFLPPKRGNIYIVPNGIRPVMQRTGIEVLCWGVRNMKKFQLSAVTSPSARFECGGYVKDSVVIKDTRRNPNFSENLLFFDVMLPREELYMPPMSIRVKDHRQFGRKPTVGVHMLKSLEDFRCDPLEPMVPVANELPPATNGSNELIPTTIIPQDLALTTALTGGGSPTSDTVITMPDGTEISEKPLRKSHELVVVEEPFSPPPVILSSDSLNTNNSAKMLPSFKIPGKLSKKIPKLPKAREVKEYILNTFIFLLPKPIRLRRERALARKRFRELRSMEESELTLMEIDWWSKYYASTNDLEKCKKYRLLNYDTLEVLPSELEKCEIYKGFNDFCHTLPLSRGKNEDDEDDNVIGEFKGSFRVYPLPQDPAEQLPPRIFQSLPPSDPEECIVRVYVIKAVDLQPNDPNGLADPYVEVELGKTKMNTRDNYVPNSINPSFGRLFELKALIPINKDLTVRVKDYDLLSTDDTIGETTIDLENRYLTKHRAICGLPKSYWLSGVNLWRDSQKPVEILQEYCRRNRLEGPVFLETTTVKVGDKTYKLSDFEKVPPFNKHVGPEEQRLALHVLNLFPLVKEHVESRPIFNPLQPNIEQGRLHMWVDIFPSSLGPPGPPFDISPRKPAQYVLRIIIWNTKDVILEEESITGEKMSDIYVQSWMAGIDEKQKTDVHYRSLDGEGNFNWRMAFPFEYQVAEQTMIVRKKEHFWSLDTTEIRTIPKLITQIWDNDKFSKDDFIGHLELNLNAMPLPAKRARNCTLKMLPDVGKDVKLVSLFEMKHMKGFWPCYDDASGTRVLSGKVEMELELLTAAQAEERPAGLGRDEPNAHPKLDMPKRPDTSFLWFTSPWKTFKHIIWRNYGCYLIWMLVIFLIILLFALFIYSFPEQLSRWMVGN